jgi:heme exporter protein A
VQSVSFNITNLKKRFNRRTIFSGISFSLKDHQSLSVVGRNGIGKSTLLKTICGLISPTEGTIECHIDGKMISIHDLYVHVGFVSPYLQLYDEFTGLENLILYRKMRKLSTSTEEIEPILKKFSIWTQRHDLVRTYSSGMKQRLKYAAAVAHNPPLLILDEPTSNLDEEGQAAVRECINEQKTKGIVIIATNNRDEFDWCDQILDLGRENNSK